MAKKIKTDCFYVKVLCFPLNLSKVVVLTLACVYVNHFWGSLENLDP